MKIEYGCNTGGRREWLDVFVPGDHKARVYIKTGDRASAEATAQTIAQALDPSALATKAAKQAELLAWLTELSQCRVDGMDDDDRTEYLRTAKRIAKTFVKELR